MEIVRQRKKRLLAWILTLVLCVGMWQGNVQAEGEEGGDGAITPTEVMPIEVGEESEDPENGEGMNFPTALATNVCVEINMKYDIDGEMIRPRIPNAIVCNKWNENNGSTWSVDSDGNILYTNAYTGDMLNLTDVSFKNGEHEHKVLNWQYEVQKDGVIQQKEQTTGQVELSNMVLTQNDTSGQYDLTAILGKSIVVKFWDGTDSSGFGQGTTIGVENISKSQESISETSYTFDLPNAGNENGYVTEWGIVTFLENGTFKMTSIGKPGDEYSVDYGSEFESNQAIIAYDYKTEISNVGNYVLCPGTKYTLSSKGWKVNNGEDGYTYGNDNGIVFYVLDKTEYSFGK